MQFRTPVLGVIAALVITGVGLAPAQASPSVNSITVSNATIYPLVGTAKHPGTTVITVDTSDPTTVGTFEIRNASGTPVRDFNPIGTTQVTWDGRDSASTVVPAGVYTVFIEGDGTTEVSPITAQITVSGLKLVQLTFTRTVSASAGQIDKYVGRCSTLRKPARRGWKGSLGYYANTRCRSQTFRASAVATQQILRLPVAEKYLDLRVNTYGGAHRHGSRGLIFYAQLGNNPPTAQRFLSARLGRHQGPLQTNLTNMVDAGRHISWGFETAYKSQYDVKTFTVVVHYDVVE